MSDIKGFFNINKPSGITSHDVVDIIRDKFGIKKVGHTGTLDPFASGVLIVAVNSGTRFIEFLNSDIKTYYVKAELGKTTDTYDITGKITEEYEVKKHHTDSLENTVNSFSGKYLQVPPVYSARRYNGKRLYEYAREGKIITLPPQEVNIFNISDITKENNTFSFVASVSAGTYIRSLIRDIGYKLGCGAYVKELKRLSAGKFGIGNSVIPEDISENSIIPVNDAVDYPEIFVNEGRKVLDGIQIYTDNIKSYGFFSKDDYVKIKDENGIFLGIGIAERNSSFIKTLEVHDRTERIVKIRKILR